MLITAISATSTVSVVVSVAALLLSSVATAFVARSVLLRREDSELRMELKSAYQREVDLVAREAFVAGMRDAVRQLEAGKVVKVRDDVLVGLPPHGEAAAWRRDSKWIAERYRAGYARAPQDLSVADASAAAAAEVIRKRNS